MDKWRAQITILARQDQAGKSVVLRDGETELARGRLERDGFERSMARFSLHIPQRGKSFGKISAKLDGQQIDGLELANAYREPWGYDARPERSCPVVSGP